MDRALFLMSVIFCTGVACTLCTLHLPHKFCIKGKKSSFEFPACAKLVRSTITFFSVWLFLFTSNNCELGECVRLVRGGGGGGG